MAKRRVEAFGQRFMARRVSKGITRAEAARRCQVHVCNLMGWEDRGTLPKDPHTIVHAVDLLECDPWWLLTGEGRPEGQP